jgi:DNA-binding transcriptional LysR family regulator
MDWNDLKYFLAVARYGSLLEAGRILQVSHPTVARRISALESDLGLKLFSRKTTGYDLTDEGLRLMQSAEQAESQMKWLGLNGDLARATTPG